MKRKTRAASGRRTVSHQPLLRLYDAFNQMQTEAISRNVRTDSFTAIERFEQMTLINRVNAGTVIGNADLNLVGAGIFFRGDFNLRFVIGLAILQSVTEQVLH